MTANRFNFRVWNKENQQMVYTDGNGYFKLENDTVITGNGDLFDLVNQETVENYILMQSTGFVDKNGNEIYEGDIIRYKGFFNTIRFINYNHQLGRLVASYINNITDYCDFNREWISKYEIIGNIYQNKDILGE